MDFKTLSKILTAFTILQITLIAQATTFHQPLIVNNAYVKANGPVIVGNYTGTTIQPAITITTTLPVTIRDSNLQGPGDLIYIKGGSLTVYNTTGTSTNPNVTGLQKGMFLNANFVSNLHVSNCTINGARIGIYINGFTGNQTSQQRIQILNNIITNIDGRPSNGNNGYVTSGDYIAHAIQLNNVLQVPYVEIAWNSDINQPGQSQVNDIISLYSSSGTSTSPMLIHDNYLQGAYPTAPGTDKIYTGGGISIDGSNLDIASTAPAFVSVYNNHIVSTANYGLQIKAGHDNTMYNNRVISSGMLPSKVYYAIPIAVGLNNVNFYNQPSTIFYNNTITNNTSGLITVTSAGAPVRADMNLPGQNNAVLGNASFAPVSNTSPTLIDEANEYALWQNSLKQAK